eukprot:9170229-Pyramimonas_sp.AAC.1
MEGYGSALAADGFDVGNIDYSLASGPDEMAPLIAGACADDVGVVLPVLKEVTRVAPVFAAAQELAHLRLQNKKCFVVPLWTRASPEVQDLVGSRL